VQVEINMAWYIWVMHGIDSIKSNLFTTPFVSRSWKCNATAPTAVRSVYRMEFENGLSTICIVVLCEWTAACKRQMY
jgi:hypothetical protein